MKILIELSFIGTAFCGWQSQKNGGSVQETLTEAAGKLFGFPCDITGCSRTDSGVHAIGYRAAITARGADSIITSIPVGAVPRALNTFLPQSISVLSAREVPDTFHPRYDVKYKEYLYRILDRPERDAFLAGRCWHIPHRLDEGAMDLGAKAFIGRHDFSSFMAAGSDIKDTVRTVTAASVVREGSTVVFRVSADGFLYNMVRIMTGTLVRIGEGKASATDVQKVISARDRSAAGVTAPAEGLFLNKVVY